MYLAELNIGRLKYEVGDPRIADFALAEAKGRLAHLEAHGNSDQAFDWSHLEHVKLWQSQKCG